MKPKTLRHATLLAFGAALVLAGCETEPTIPGEAHTTTTTTTTTTEPPLTLSQAQAQFAPLGTPAPDVRLQNEAGVFLPGTTKAYAVGRYRDPGNRSILHEQHVIYRHEEDSSFKMNTGRENEVVVGNTANGGGRRYNMIRPARLQRSELDAALTREESTVARANEKSDRLQASSDALIAATKKFDDSATVNNQTSGKVGTLEAQVNDLSGQVRELKQNVPPPLPETTPTPTPAPTKARVSKPSKTDDAAVGSDGKIHTHS